MKHEFMPNDGPKIIVECYKLKLTNYYCFGAASNLDLQKSALMRISIIIQINSALFVEF